MDNLRVSIVVEENCLPTEGGGYSYYQTLVKAIDDYEFPSEIEISYLLPPGSGKQYPFRKRTINTERAFDDNLAHTFLNKLYRFIHWLYPKQSAGVLDQLTKMMSRLTNQAAVRALKKQNVDLVYYLKPNDNPMDYPMIVTHWDVGHKSMYPFPEVASPENYQKREAYYLNTLNKAMVILCESAAGAAELKHYYPINDNKIKVLPIFGGEVISLAVSDNEQLQILNKFRLQKDRYFFYPAQFWAHKNHFNLVNAFNRLVQREENRDFILVLSGADQGNMAYIKQVVASLKLEKSVLFTGFVNNRILHTFYRNAVCLVMPTYLGPTNLPLIEAAMLECAVACTDLEGHRQILGNSALYFDPANDEAISECMISMLEPALRERYKANALRHISDSDFHVEKSLGVLEKVLVDIKPVRKAWGAVSGVLHLVTCANFGIINF